jgi:hypothetical protein
MQEMDFFSARPSLSKDRSLVGLHHNEIVIFAMQERFCTDGKTLKTLIEASAPRADNVALTTEKAVASGANCLAFVERFLDRENHPRSVL